MTEFPCPHCHTPLRVRDKTFRDQVILCPDCQGRVLILDVNGVLRGVLSDGEADRSETSKTPLKSKWSGPRVIAACVSTVLVVSLILYSVDWGGTTPPPGAEPLLQAKDANDGAETPSLPSPEPVPQAEPMRNVPDDTNRNPLENQLASIGGLVKEAMQREQRFPLEDSTPGKPGWSWIAELSDYGLPNTVSRRLDAGWNAPVNDEFVRRPFPEFLNPVLQQRAGEDGYPTTHYVGISEIANADGKGTSPGIFGTGKPLRVTDIDGGLSETILVAGITTDFGAWARPGRATARSLTREPFINGPDGFGTGQPEGMFVLLADGSVKFLNQKTDAEVVRRLARVTQKTGPGGLADAPTENSMESKSVEPAASVTGKDADKLQIPIAVPVSPDIPKINIQARLNQRVAGFEQRIESDLEEILFDIQELLGVSVDLSQLSEEIRQRPVRVSLKSVTVGDILKEIAAAAQVGYSVHPDHIEVHPLQKD